MRVKDLTKQYDGKTVVDSVSFEIPKGKVISMIGPNGAGKSTVLNIISRLIARDSGLVDFDGRDIGKWKSKELAKRLAILTQSNNIQMKLTVRELVTFGRFPYSGSHLNEEDQRIIDKAIAYMELEPFQDRFIDELSGGQRQRAYIAMVIAQDTEFILLDEPTNNLDINAVNWLEDFLLDFEGTVIVVSHDRHFLNTICTHIVDIDYNKIKMYVGNYDFWYDASQLMQNLMKNQNKKNEEKAQELKEFISRFSANKSKSKQATARRKLLEKITLEEIPASSRRYPWVAFSPDREVGKDILFVTDVSKTIDGVKVLDKVSFIVGHGDKIAFVGDNENAQTALFQILTGELEPDEGTVKWGQTATFSYFPKDNTKFFKDCDDNLVEWLRQWSSDPHEAYLRGFLGRMLFSGDEVYKPVKVLSGGEKVRCMLSRMMLSGANVLLLDQPTNHLDLESIAALNNGLEAVKCNVLVSSHDHQLIQTVCNRVFDFTAEGKLIDRMMSYDEYLESQKPQG